MNGVGSVGFTREQGKRRKGKRKVKREKEPKVIRI
jgi:hypothetical protein